MTRVAVSGALANRPGNAGGAALRITWVEALRRLGLEVWFVEQIGREQLRDERGRKVAAECSVAARFFLEMTGRCGLIGAAALLDEGGESMVGLGRRDVEELAATTDLLINLGGHLRVPSLVRRFRRKVYLDLDPGFTQLWHAAGSAAAGLDGHDHYFTVGLNVGSLACSIPVDGIPWRPLPPPVILEEWPLGDGGLDAFTTVATWRSPFGRVEHRGRTYGLKVHEMRRLLDLPSRVPVPLEIALDIDPGDGADLAALLAHGWRIVHPRERVPNPESYRRYIRGSGAELSAAQGIYVETASGWVSDRTVRYLAAGRPALVQDTGLGRQLPVGEGLLVFRTLDEAASGAAEIAANYQQHRLRARQLAEEHFASDRVVGRLLENVGVAP